MRQPAALPSSPYVPCPRTLTTRHRRLLYFANSSVALRSSSGSVHCTKHNYPDHRDKSERHKRGPRHELLPVVGLWTKPPNLSVTTVTAPFRDQCFFRHRTVAPRRCHDYHSFNLGPLNGRPYFFRERLAPMRLRLQ